MNYGISLCCLTGTAVALKEWMIKKKIEKIPEKIFCKVASFYLLC